jgi:hypothetical protein
VNAVVETYLCDFIILLEKFPELSLSNGNQQKKTEKIVNLKKLFLKLCLQLELFLRNFAEPFVSNSRRAVFRVVPKKSRNLFF